MLRTVENAREENVPTTTIVDCVTVCANASVAPTNSIVFSIFSTAHESDRNSRINSRTLRMTEYGKTVMKTEVSAQTKVGLAEVELQESLASTNNYSNSTANQFASLDRQCSSNIQASQVDDGWGGAHHGAPITVALAANYRCSIRSSSHHFSQHSSHHHFVLMTKKPLGYCCRQIPSTSHHHSACRSPLVSQTSNTAYGARRRDDDSDETNQTRIAVMRNVCSKQIATQCSFIASFKTNRQSNALSYRKNNNNNNNHNVVQYRRPSRSLSPILNSEHFAATNIADQFDQIRIGAEQRRRMQTNSSFVPIHSGTQYRGEPIPCNIRAKASPSRERRKTTQNREKQKKTLMLIKPECELNLCPHSQTQSASHWSLIYCKRLFHPFQSSLIQSLITFEQLLLLLFSTLLSSLHLQLFNLCPPYFNELKKSSSSASSTVASIFSCLEIGNNNKEKKTPRCLKQSFIRTSKSTKSLCFSQLNFVSFCFLLLLSNSGCLPAVSAQFPSDDVEAALEPPPSAQRSTPSTTANNNNNISAHHRRHPEQKQTEIGLNITKILNAFFDSGYDKRVRPNYAGPPVEVGVTMHIISISSISAVQMDFTSDFYFRQAWRDSRLSFTPRPGIEALFVGAEVSEKIWVPDTFFANEKSAQFHMATTPNTFIRIKANGEVFRSMRLTVTSSCPMNLQYFPMDRQSCTIEVESYGYSMADIQYHWGIDGKGSVNLANNLELPQFKVNKHRQMTKVEVLSTGNYSRLVCEIEFVRSMGYYLIQIYIPASLIVIISWVSFWLHRNASPARVQLGVTTVLTMTTLMSSTNAAMPKISYIKSIDVFLGTCFVMVFAALLEYATVGYMGKRIAMRKSRTQQIVRMLNEHRERCIAAAAAAAATQQNGKIGDDIRFGSGGSSSGSGGAQHPAMVRTASLYQDLDDGTLHKRELRSGSCYPQAATFGAVVPPATLHRSLERTASMKSRIYSDCDDPETTGMTNFNDDLSVFVSANTGTGASGGTVGGSIAGGPSGSHYATNGTGLGYHYQERNSEAWPHQHGRSATLNDRLYLPSNYVVKDHNTLFGVCPSDIDKYSRVVFPVCFLCFNLMYWIIYMHISEFLTDDQGLNSTQTTINDSGE